MTDLITLFQKFVRDQQLNDQKILLMVSGGVDSMVLLDIACQALDKDQIVVLHINHNTRKEAQEDFKFVQNICSKKGVPFLGKTLSKNDIKKSPESLWREQRRTISTEVAESIGATKILTAHHATDLVETMIFRLTKGAGPNGLSPFDKTTKPFWNIPKTELLKYAQDQKIDWKEDESNTNTGFERNLIRHEVLPELRKITPNLEKVFVRESIIFTEIQEFITQATQKVVATHPLPLKEFLALPSIIQKEFLRQISNSTPSHSEIEDCLRWLTNEPSGNSEKKLGQNYLLIQNHQIHWQV